MWGAGGEGGGVGLPDIRAALVGWGTGQGDAQCGAGTGQWRQAQVDQRGIRKHFRENTNPFFTRSLFFGSNS